MPLQIPYLCMFLVGATAGSPSICFAAPGSGRAEVVAIQNARIADVVILDTGSASGLRQGMTCEVSRGSVGVGSVLLVEVRATASAALISTLNSGQSLNAGDRIEIKILKTQFIVSNL